MIKLRAETLPRFSAERRCPVCDSPAGDFGLTVVYCDPESPVQQSHLFCTRREIMVEPPQPHVHRICATCGYHLVETLSAQKIKDLTPLWTPSPPEHNPSGAALPEPTITGVPDRQSHGVEP